MAQREQREACARGFLIRILFFAITGATEGTASFDCFLSEGLKARAGLEPGPSKTTEDTRSAAFSEARAAPRPPQRVVWAGHRVPVFEQDHSSS